MFGDVLFTSRQIVLSSEQNDIASHFIYWRAFAADQLQQGHLPLWNPHLFCGTPFLGWSQSGVLYPPNWLDLLLPLPLSINLGIALHVFLAGLFTYVWALRRGLHPVAAVTSGALFMFCGAYFLHVYGGHPSLLSAMAWMPLVLASVDGWIQTRTRGWMLLGTAAVAMQILAADPQGCFYTAVAAGLLLAFELIRAPQRLKAILGFFGMYAGAAALGAVQLLTSFQAASESVRGSGVSYEFASMISFAPENFLTLLAPGFFGNMVTVPYWGRWYWWEMCLFIGVVGLVLAVYGAVCGKREIRRSLVPLTLILLVFALGANTPLFRLLYHAVPGFDRFRANAKFIMEASLFMVMLAGAGLDRLLHSPQGNKWWALGLLVTAVIVGGAAIELRLELLAPESKNWWLRAMQTVYATRASDLPATVYTTPSSVRQAGAFASKCLLIAAAEFFIVSGLMFWARASRKAVYAMGLMAVAEIFVFARSSRATFELSSTQAPKLKAFLDQRPGDYRIFYQRIPNIAMWLGKEDVWGYAPLTLKRYAEFMAFTQGQSPEGSTQYLDFSRFHPFHAMLRWRYAFVPAEEGDRILTSKVVMPRLQLIHEYRVIKGRDEILQTMASTSFDLLEQVILETEPTPRPTYFVEKGRAQIVDSSAGELTIEADLPHPAILLITDAYSTGWRARPLEGSAQRAYQVLPANYILRAIPLSQGHHRIRLEYLPAAFQAGKWISIISIIGFGFIGGDGTGPEVVREAVKVLDVAAKKFNLKLNYTHYDFGGDRYLRTKEALPDSAVDELRKFPAILARRDRPSRREAGHSGKGHSAAPAFRAGAIHQSPSGETLRRTLLPAEGQEAGAHRFRRRARKQRRALHRRGRLCVQRHAARSRRAGKHQHPARRRALPALRLRVHPQTRNKDEEADALRQDQRA